MDTKVVYLHGIGGPSDRDEWLPILNQELARVGFERIHRSDVIDYDYSPILLGKIGSGLYEPRVTVDKAEGREDAARRYVDNVTRFKTFSSAEEARTGWLSAAPSPVPDQFANFILEVSNYSNSQDVRFAVWAHVLSRLPPRGRVVLVGHSLGSVIAADVACRAPESLEIAGLITVASPLGGVPQLRKGSSTLATTGGFPYERIRMWVNIYSPNDAVTVGHGIAKHYPAALDQPIPTGPITPGGLLENHGIAFHAGHPAVAQAVGWAVFGDPAPAAPDNLPAVQLDSFWDAHFLTFANAEALMKAIPPKKAERRAKLRRAIEESARRVEEQSVAGLAELQSLARQATGPEREQILELAEQAKNYPTADMLIDRSAAQLEGRFLASELPSYAVALLHGLPLPPFEVEGNQSDERVEALATVLDTICNRRDIDTTAEDMARMADESLRNAEKVMGIGRGGWVKWAVMGAGGAVLIAGTVITAGMMAPAGLAGAAAITAALAAFGPGGMVGGIATIAALTGTGAAIAAGGGLAAVTGNVGEQERRRVERRAQIRAAIVELAATVEPQQLRSSLAAFIAVVMLQEQVNVPSARQEVFQAVQEALAALRLELATTVRVEEKSGYTKAINTKCEILETAAGWLEPLPSMRDLENLKALLSD